MEEEMIMIMINSFLPVELIITEIIPRLPAADSILQYKRVCKTWRTLIDKLLDDFDSFIDKHTHQFISSSSSSVAASASCGFLLRVRLKGRSQFQFHIGEYTSNNNNNDYDYDGDESSLASSDNPIKLVTKKISTNPNPFPFLMDIYPMDWNLVSSCNGLICLISNSEHPQHYNVWIGNPLTREYVNLFPQFKPSSTSNMEFQGMLIGSVIATGFGYHPSINKYKFVIITRNRVEGNQDVTVSVYTLGSGKWINKAREFPYDIISSTNGVLVNGALYWGTTKWYDHNNYQIVSFDLEDNEFRIIPSPPPPPLQSFYHGDDELGVLGGCLCATRKIGTYCVDFKEIWVMNQKDCSWTKNFYLPATYPTGIRNTPLGGLLKGNQILLSYDYMKFDSYDPKTITLETIAHSINLGYGCDWFEMIPYIKSFVSLKVLGENVNVANTRKRKRRGKKRRGRCLGCNS